MSDYKERHENEIFTKVLKAGRRTYFFDVRETKAGDYYPVSYTHLDVYKRQFLHLP